MKQLFVTLYISVTVIFGANHVWDGDGSLLSVLDTDTVEIKSGANDTLYVQSGEITIIGNVLEYATNIALYIEPGARVIWKAVYIGNIYGDIIYIWGGGNLVIAEGAVVENYNSDAIYSTSVRSRIIIDGGCVSSLSGNAIANNGPGAIIKNGVVFGRISGNYTIEDKGIIISWDRKGDEFENGTSQGLVSEPEGKAYWAVKDGKGGIKNMVNDIFIPIMWVNVNDGGTFIDGIQVKSHESFAFAGIKNGHINLRLQSGNYTAELYNFQGRLVGRDNITALNGINSVNLKIDNLSNGIFLLNVKRGETSVFSHKIMKK